MAEPVGDYLSPRRAAEAEPFVLDRIENPHPRMLTGALNAQDAAERWPKDEVCAAYWQGYLAAMVDATGCDEADMLAWLERRREVE